MTSRQPKIIRQPIRPGTQFALGVFFILVLGCLYLGLSHRQHRRNPSDTTIPNLSQLWDGVKMVTAPGRNGRRWVVDDTVTTLTRLSSGLLLGVTISVVLGVAMGCFPLAEASFLPTLSFLAKITPTAMIAVFFVAVGVGEMFYISVIVFGIAPTLTQAVFRVTRNDVPMNYVYKGYTLGASLGELVVNIVFPKILPAVIESTRLVIGPALVFLISAEYYTGDVGIGYRVKIQSRIQNMNVVYLYLVELGLIGLVLDRVFSFVRKKLCPWFMD